MKSIRTEGSEGMLKENVRKGIKVNGTIPFPNGFPNFWYETLFWEKLLLRMTASSLDSLHEPLERIYSNSRCVNNRLEGETESSQAKLAFGMVVHFLNAVTLPLRVSTSS